MVLFQKNSLTFPTVIMLLPTHQHHVSYQPEPLWLLLTERTLTGWLA